MIVFCDSVLRVVFGARGSFQDGLVCSKRCREILEQGFRTPGEAIVWEKSDEDIVWANGVETESIIGKWSRKLGEGCKGGIIIA